MKLVIKIIFSIFFAIAIGVHINEYFIKGNKPFWWHLLYFISYGLCWIMFFIKQKNKTFVYFIMALFPFITHIYYGYKHIEKLDEIFWICTLVCLLLPLGFMFLKTNFQSK